MPFGTLEVLLVNAKDLVNTDYLTNMDPYCILTCKSQEKRSSVVSGGGSNPKWNETFLFTISEGASELRIKIMDKDTFTDDDSVGETRIKLETVLYEGRVPPTSYNVVKDGKYYGSIKIGLVFIPEPNAHGGSRGQDQSYGGSYEQEQNYGGWKQSSTYY